MKFIKIIITKLYFTQQLNCTNPWANEGLDRIPFYSYNRLFFIGTIFTWRIISLHRTVETS